MKKVFNFFQLFFIGFLVPCWLKNGCKTRVHRFIKIFIPFHYPVSLSIAENLEISLAWKVSVWIWPFDRDINPQILSDKELPSSKARSFIFERLQHLRKYSFSIQSFPFELVNILLHVLGILKGYAGDWVRIITFKQVEALERSAIVWYEGDFQEKTLKVLMIMRLILWSNSFSS